LIKSYLDVPVRFFGLAGGALWPEAEASMPADSCPSHCTVWELWKHYSDPGTAHIALKVLSDIISIKTRPYTLGEAEAAPRA
jgi:hypothetical protein